MSTRKTSQANPKQKLLEVAYRHDMLGRISEVIRRDTDESLATYRYLPNGSLATEVLGKQSLVRTFRYDSMQRLCTVEDPAFTQRLSFREEGVAANPYGNGTVQAEQFAFQATAFASSKPTDYRYIYRWDPFHRLISAASASAEENSSNFRYDANGNILHCDGEGGSQTYGYVTGRNQLRDWKLGTGPAAVFQYSPDGSLEFRQSGNQKLELRYDRRSGQMAKVSAPSGGDKAQYHYGFAPWRVLKTSGSNGGKRLYMSGGGKDPLLELPSGNAPSTAYFYGPTGLVGVNFGGKAYTISKDNRGSVVAVWGDGGKVQGYCCYRPFGGLNVGNSRPAPISRRYLSHEFEEEFAWYNFGARIYDPTLGRFLRPDPAHQTPSPYAYVANNPIENVDPDGRVIKHVIYFEGKYYLFAEDYLLRMVFNEGEAVNAFVRMHRSPLGKTGSERTALYESELRLHPKGHAFYNLSEAEQSRSIASLLTGRKQKNYIELDRERITWLRKQKVLSKDYYQSVVWEGFEPTYAALPPLAPKGSRKTLIRTERKQFGRSVLLEKPETGEKNRGQSNTTVVSEKSPLHRPLPSEPGASPVQETPPGLPGPPNTTTTTSNSNEFEAQLEEMNEQDLAFLENALRDLE